MVFYFYFFLFLSVISFFYITIKLKDIANPVSLSFVFFIIPLIANRMMLSQLQSKIWEDETYLLIINFIIAFIIIPTFILNKSNKINKFKNIPNARKQLTQPKSTVVYILFFLDVILQLILNKLNSGTFIPLINLSELTKNYHVVSVSFFGIFFKGIHFIIVFLIFKKYYECRRIIFFIMFIILLCMPLTRLARMDIIQLIVVISVFILIRTHSQKKVVLSLFLVGVFVAILGSGIAKYRWSIGGKIDVSFAEVIKYDSIKGPNEVFPFLYAYFPLSIENVNRFVAANEYNKSYSYGTFMFRPIMVGFFKLHHLEGFPFRDFLGQKQSPLSGVSNVPTALPAFAVDFGILLSILPMVFYSLIGVFLYIYRYKGSMINLELYSFYSVSYFLLSFQNTFIEPSFLYIFLLLLIYRKVSKIGLKKILREHR